MQTYLGLGRTRIQPAEEYERKSVGTESTFRDMQGSDQLHKQLRWTAEELEKDLSRTKFKGKTLVLKIKLHTYEVLTRQVVLPKAICSADETYRFALPMLTKLEKEIPGMKLRLMGLRCTHLVSTKKAGIDFFGSQRAAIPSASKRDSEGEWEVWPEEEFEEAARQEELEEMNETERLSQEDPEKEALQEYTHGKEILPNPKRDSSPKQEAVRWNCPICGRGQEAEDRAFNDHIDHCLSRKTIKEAVQATSIDREPLLASHHLQPVNVGGGRGGKRKVDHSRLDSHFVQLPKKQRSFFGS